MGFSYACEAVVTQIASRIQGITVEIGGDTTKLSKALESVNKSIKGTQSGLKDVNKLLKLDPSCKFRFIGSPIPLATDQCFRS